jgi:hypothetical protein
VDAHRQSYINHLGRKTDERYWNRFYDRPLNFDKMEWVGEGGISLIAYAMKWSRRRRKTVECCRIKLCNFTASRPFNSPPKNVQFGLKGAVQWAGRFCLPKNMWGRGGDKAARIWSWTLLFIYRLLYDLVLMDASIFPSS